MREVAAGVVVGLLFAGWAALAVWLIGSGQAWMDRKEQEALDRIHNEALNLPAVGAGSTKETT